MMFKIHPVTTGSYGEQNKIVKTHLEIIGLSFHKVLSFLRSLGDKLMKHEKDNGKGILKT